ncbi:class I SAM-dependent methyltransferase [Aegicerativicinus sediminis]|uniref:class I SAM-dependent methyltransferase n=1 Tax=Aegicerativicinus sediminis TaxID=2893202 RepID=UPI001E529628|nr:class I SAM-dependent methyltransferase [Aegicerativicinus sediminis]
MQSLLKVIDHSVSKELFELQWNNDLNCLETCPKPSIELIGEYYESDNYISHTDRNKTFIEKLYHLVRSYNLIWKRKIIEKHFEIEDKLVLDIGCGTGDFLEEMKNSGWKVKGVEPNEEARKIANSKISNNVIAPDQSLNGIETRFSCISMWHVLEHMYDPIKQAKEIADLLVKDGLAVIAVPNYKSWDANHYQSYWAAYDVPRHLWHFSKDSVVQLFESNGFELVKIYPMLMDSFYVSILSEKYKSSAFPLLKGLIKGFKSNMSARKTGEYSSLTYLFRKIDI